MPKFLARRAAMLVAALVVSSFAIFASLDLAPGDPLATLSGGRTLPPEAVAQLRAQYHLDDPFLSRYVHWLANALHGDLGTSIAFREPVSNVISARIGVTIELVAYAALLIVLFGVGLGLLSGLRRGAIDSSILVVTTVFAAVPSFVAAIVLLSLFSVNLGWFPALGAGDGGVADAIKHLTLPAIALALSAMAIVVRVTRVAVRTELGREHVQTAVSRGIPFRQVVRRHVLRNAAIPVTTVVGITITALIALSSVVERAFSLDGLGAALVQAALSKDFAVVQGISLLFVAAFVVANALVDLCYALLDPRVAIGARAT
jgi:peptide/nickel transport system permease protein